MANSLWRSNGSETDEEFVILNEDPKYLGEDLVVASVDSSDDGYGYDGHVYLSLSGLDEHGYEHDVAVSIKPEEARELAFVLNQLAHQIESGENDN